MQDEKPHIRRNLCMYAQLVQQHNMSHGKMMLTDTFKYGDTQHLWPNDSHTILMSTANTCWNGAMVRQLWTNLGFLLVSCEMFEVGGVCGGTGAYCLLEFTNHTEASRAISRYYSNQFSLTTGVITGLYWILNRYHVESTLLLHGLPLQLNETAFINFLLELGYHSFDTVEILRDPNTSASRGLALIQFKEGIEMQKILVELQGIHLSQSALPLTILQFTKQYTLSHSYSNSPSPLLFSSHSLSSSSSSLEDPTNTTVFIGGLSSLVTENELRSLFQPFGEIVYVKIPFGKGCGFVQYETRKAAELAIHKMKGVSIKNSKIRLSWGKAAKTSNTRKRRSSSNVSSNANRCSLLQNVLEAQAQY
ncbi:hypothetical protein TBLA_0A03300 [Henningerozyma blattae CBS 6284]|uniref:RRM domain-containing protein n=1 Tax=Henningerozyma blattae (strain ATCC 34711 / CBS 6284 / DSM 70876 / NBRC 10599 / NRRL Y-10934 / UCD 77-7) TaxID=1071380 RepID=I2GVH8_HENB6|nr:hypothetical protein TBLA_0A03300 [Tetrapisispora blattae CBS 6284]CCH58130.1 hypothetical protein TBLA_0A03300 [Tetrapisispora blattae CBS 6284]